MIKNNRSRAYVIANLSTNHEGNVELANEMIEKACVSKHNNINLYYTNDNFMVNNKV